MSTLCSVAFYFVFDLSFIFSFISHPSCIIIIVRSFISCPHFSLTLCLILTKRGRVYSREYTGVFCHFYMTLVMTLVHILRGEKFYFSCTFVGGEIFHSGDAYTKGEKTLCYLENFVLFVFLLTLWCFELCFVVLIASCLCFGHAFIPMLLCFFECMFV